MGLTNDVVSPEGLRVDGRRPTELRSLKCKTGIISLADGSAYFALGNTNVIAIVYGPRELSKKSTTSNKPNLNFKISVAAFANSRKSIGKRDRRLLEIADSLKKTFQEIIILSGSQRSEIDINLQILQLDGGLLHCLANATTLALIDAGIPMIDYCLSCSAGWVDKTCILDLNMAEENADVPTLTLSLLPKSNQVVLSNLEARIPLDNLEEVIMLSTEGCKRLFDSVDQIIRTRTKELSDIIQT